MGKPSAKQQVSEFSMSIHLGLVHGMDGITGLFVGEKLAWEGDVTETGGIFVNAPNLFGGPKSQGGVGGAMYYLPGDPDQVMPEALAARLGYTSDTCPAFRGIASVFFVGTDGIEYGSLDIGAGGGGGTGGAGTPVSDDGTPTGGGGYSTGGGGGGGFSGRNPEP